MLVVENEKPLEPYVPPLVSNPFAKVEDPAKVKRVVVQNNPQKMALDKTLSALYWCINNSYWIGIKDI